MNELKVWRVAAWIAALAWWLNPGSSRADVCIPHVTGVPGLWGQPPHWAGASPPDVRAVPDDPRWLGAMRQSFPQDMAVQSHIRALSDGTHLYLSFATLVRPGDPLPGYDAVYLGFAQSAASEARLIKLTLNTGSTTSAGTPSGLNAAYFTRAAGASGWTGVAPPASPWIENRHLWADSVGDTWTANVRVNLANLGLAAPFRTFFAIHTQLTTLPPVAVQYVYPAGGASGPFGESDLAPIDPALFQTTTLGTAAAQCTDGITLAYNQIGTMHADPTFVDTDGANVFRVNPDWGPVAPAAELIQARFRLAHWGSVADPSAAWSEFANVRNGTNGAPVTEIRYPCGGGGGQPACPALGAGEHPHQCLMVELSGVSLGVHFARDSSWNNMRFASASTFTSPALISLKGMPPIGAPAAPREVYLYVKTTNMPAQVVGGDRQGVPKGSLERERAAAREYRYPRVRDLGNRPGRIAGLAAAGGAGGQPGAPGGTGGAANAAAGQGGAAPEPVLDSDRGLHERLRATRPTYEVHTYYDSGRSAAGPSGQFRLYRPMIPFGYFVYHEGPLDGWFTRLEAEGGYVLTEIAPNFYRAKIPEGGAMPVRTTIVARAPGDPVPPAERGHRCQCDLVRPRSGGLLEFGAALALALGGMLRAHRGRRRRGTPRS